MQFCGEHFGKTCKIGCLPASIQASCNLTRARSSFCLLESCARITLKLWRYRTCFCSTYAKPAKVLFVARLLCSPRLQFDFKHSIQVSAKDCCKSTQLKNSSGTLQYVVKGGVACLSGKSSSVHILVHITCWNTQHLVCIPTWKNCAQTQNVILSRTSAVQSYTGTLILFRAVICLQNTPCASLILLLQVVLNGNEDRKRPLPTALHYLASFWLSCRSGVPEFYIK